MDFILPKASNLESLLLFQLQALKIEPIREFRFHQKRRWRFDFAYPEIKMAIEVQGGVFTNGAHVRGAFYQKEMEKFRIAAMHGWKVLPYTSPDIRSGNASKEIFKFYNYLYSQRPKQTEALNLALSKSTETKKDS